MGDLGDARWIDPAFYGPASLDPPRVGRRADGARRRGSVALRAGGSECGRGGAAVRRRSARRSGPGAAHSAPFQPSPHESVISRVHVAPSATASGALEVYGAPPLSVVPSEQLRLQPTSYAYLPLGYFVTNVMIITRLEFKGVPVVSSLFGVGGDDDSLEKSWMMATDPQAMSANGIMDISMMKSFDRSRRSPLQDDGIDTSAMMKSFDGTNRKSPAPDESVNIGVSTEGVEAAAADIILKNIGLEESL